MVVKEAIAVIQVRNDDIWCSMVVMEMISDWMLDIFRKVEPIGFPDGLDMRCEEEEKDASRFWA